MVRSRTRRVAVVIALGASLLVTGGPVGATTSVTVKGRDVTLTMTVGVVDAKGKTGPDGRPLVKHWQQILDDTWGAAFRAIPYKGCYLLHLDVTLRALGPNGEAGSDEHQIVVSAPTGGLTFEGTGFDGAPETSRDPTTGDGSRSYEHPRDGAIPSDAAPTVVAHEFGHLFGLGDDRSGGVAKNGRDGTLMVGGLPGQPVDANTRIDKELIGRIGRQIEQELKREGKKLPPCETYRGPFTSQVGGGVSCTGSSDGTLTVGVVRGDAVATLDVAGSYTCEGITVPGAGSIGFRGTGSDDELDLGLADLSTAADPTIAPGCLVGQPLRIPLDRDGSGAADFSYTAPSSDVYSCRVEVTRDAGEDEPVG